MTRTTLLVLFLFLFLAAGARAEDRWSWELRTGADPVGGDFATGDLGTGFGFEATVAYRLQPHLAAYAGWGWHHFGVDAPGTDALEETGYSFGLQFVHPTARRGLGYVVRAGAVLRHFELEDDDGDVVDDSGHGLGYEIGAGLDIALPGNWSLRPGLTYRSLSRDVEIDGVEREVDLGGVDFEIGFARAF